MPRERHGRVPHREDIVAGAVLDDLARRRVAARGGRRAPVPFGERGLGLGLSREGGERVRAPTGLAATRTGPAPPTWLHSRERESWCDHWRVKDQGLG